MDVRLVDLRAAVLPLPEFILCKFSENASLHPHNIIRPFKAYRFS